MPPVEPPPSRWAFPNPSGVPEDVVGLGADLLPGTLLAAYRGGLFPMEVAPGALGWWSPQRRGILPLGGLHVGRRLERSLGRFELRVDTAFDAVVDGCAAQPRPGGWITDEIAAAYRRLHRLGWAHSVEAWDGDDGSLCGGLYGVAIGGLFAGESMFHRRPEASKSALVGLVALLGGAAGEAEGRLLDCQWRTPHLASLGAVEVSRAEYLGRLREAVRLPLPAAFA